MGAIHGYKIDNNIEWLASGLSNVTAIFTGGGVPGMNSAVIDDE